MTASPLRSDYRPPSEPAALDRWLSNREEDLAEVLSREITRIVQRSVRAFQSTLPALIASGDMSVFDDIPLQWSSVVDNRLLPEIEQVYLGGGINVWASAPASIPTAAARAWADVVNVSAAEYVTQRRNMMVGVGDNLFQGVMQQVDRAITTGASTEEIKQSLERLGNFSEFRADVIARTEIQTAYANGNWEASVALGEYGPVEKEWLATSDARTRDTHRDINGTVLPFSQPFFVGGAQMMFPKDPSGPASEVVQCRCVLLEYWPGDPRRDGSIVPERITQQVPEPPAQTLVPDDALPQPISPTSPYGRGPQATQKFTDLVQLPEAQRGRLVERVKVLDEAVKALDDLHGMPSAAKEIDVVLGGKADLKGGHFTPATRGARPKKQRGITIQEWVEKVKEYNARPIRGEIRINDKDLKDQVGAMVHELGHATDWDGATFRSRAAWTSPQVRTLHSKYGRAWMDHLDEIVDEESRLFGELGKIVREAESVKTYTKNSQIAFREYFTSIEEVWARSYMQWAGEVLDMPLLSEHLRERQTDGYQFTDEEFQLIKPIVERVLRLRGLMK